MQLSAVVHSPNGTAVSERFYATSMPEAWVRGAMLIRCNSLLRGHSAVRLSVIQSLAELLRQDIIPLVPLRGSISASGDLCPLSYIAAALEGNPDVWVWTGDKKARQLVRSNEALLEAGIKPVSFEAKEGLGLLNGTAVSCSVAALALYEANHLAVMSQVLTAMAVEALGGTAESFDAFIAEVRPHKGQIEASRNIRFFLRGSRLVRSHGASGKDDAGDLRQDRYAIRTAAQWIGPQLEDLTLAHKQLEIELNSTTDNPLIHVAKGKVLHGGNFQAASVTSSTEKTRSALQMIGKMLFAQCSELLNQNLSNGLPPNLAADEPSLSYTMKGVDINMAAYMSELAFLANPVSSHVQSAEMCNQSINSMALVSARYTHMAIDVLSLMSSAYLFALCQALDLRAMHISYLQSLQPPLECITNNIWGPILHPAKLDTANGRFWKHMLQALDATVTKDSTTRFVEIAKSALPVLIECCGDLQRDAPCFLNAIQRWTDEVAVKCYEVFITNRLQYFANPDASPHLGAASKRMYKFVREELQIPFHRGLQDYPVSNSPEAGGTFPSSDERVANTGTWISTIYEALRDGKLMIPVLRCLEESQRVHINSLVDQSHIMLATGKYHPNVYH
jgi:phenylalanine ammonia-lyase